MAHEDDIKEVLDRVRAIECGLLGDPADPLKPNVVSTLRDLSSRVTNMETNQKQWRGWLMPATISAVFTLAINAAKSLIPPGGH